MLLLQVATWMAAGAIAFNTAVMIRIALRKPASGIAEDSGLSDHWLKLNRRVADTSAKMADFEAYKTGQIRWDAADWCRNGLGICPECDAEARVYKVGTDLLVCAACGFSS